MSLLGGGTVLLFRLTSVREKQAPIGQAAPPENPDHELKALEVQLERKPGHLPVLLRMAQIERDQGKLGEAVEHLRQAAAGEPKDPDVHLELGRALYEKGDQAEALKETERSLALKPDNVDALYNLGAIYANSGEPQRARSYWDQAVALDAASDSGKKAREGLSRLAGR
jgi:Flp pilus assembly protein TadD